LIRYAAIFIDAAAAIIADFRDARCLIFAADRDAALPMLPLRQLDDVAAAADYYAADFWRRCCWLFVDAIMPP